MTAIMLQENRKANYLEGKTSMNDINKNRCFMND